ncbi:MAG: hypothetical protein IPK10_19510 [Bacteroidetes bacterium]|nr:hypothetical protein [Bacteroidota bacterium]
MKKYILLLILVVFSTAMIAQQTSTSAIQYFPLKKVYDLSPGVDKWMPILQNQKLPKPHPGTDERTVKETKELLENLYGNKRVQPTDQQKNSATNAPVLLSNFIGNSFNLYVPNDNDIAVSNGGFVSSVNNTMIYGKNTVTNQVYSSVALHTLVAALGLTQEECDPKVVYDPNSDRFIVIMLNGFNDTTSNVLVGFFTNKCSFWLVEFLCASR